MELLTKDEIMKVYPHCTPRAHHLETIQQIVGTAAKEIIFEGDPGIGKTTITQATMQLLPTPSLVIVPNHKLQEDYIDPLGKIKMLQGRTAYICDIDPTKNCAEASCTEETHRAFEQLRKCLNEGNCEYYRNKRAALVTSKQTVLSYSGLFTHLLAGTDLTKFRNCFFDEVQNLDTMLTQTFAKTFDLAELHRRFPNLDVGRIERGHKVDDVFRFLNFDLIPAVDTKIAELERDGDTGFVGFQISKLTTELKHCQLLLEAIRSGDRFHIDATDGEFNLKPVEVTHIAQWLFAQFDKVVLMSGTILNQDLFCNLLGIDRDKVLYLKVPTAINPQQRTLIYRPIQNMSRKTATPEGWVRMKDAVERILDCHANQKGIIHTVSSKNTKLLALLLKDNPRLIVHTDELSATDVFDLHEDSLEPTVIVSHAMTEGVDLKHDLARFQILIKMPYPPSEDPIVKGICKVHPEWYAWRTLRALIQAMNRSTRDLMDHSISYLLDAEFENFIERNEKVFMQVREGHFNNLTIEEGHNE